MQTITETFPQDNNSKFDSEFSTENGLANSRFHTLLFGINRLRSDELPHCWAKSPCSGAFVQLLCDQNFNALPCRSTPFTTVNYGETLGRESSCLQWCLTSGGQKRPGSTRPFKVWLDW